MSFTPYNCSPEQFLDDLETAGITASVTPQGKLAFEPGSNLSPADIEYIKSNRDRLIAILRADEIERAASAKKLLTVSNPVTLYAKTIIRHCPLDTCGKEMISIKGGLHCCSAHHYFKIEIPTDDELMQLLQLP